MPESNFILFVSSLAMATGTLRATSLNGQQLTPPLGALTFMYPLKSSQNSKHHTFTEITLGWQNHASSRAWGKSWSAAADRLSYPHGIKTNKHAYKISVFKETKILKLKNVTTRMHFKRTAVLKR